MLRSVVRFLRLVRLRRLRRLRRLLSALRLVRLPLLGVRSRLLRRRCVGRSLLPRLRLVPWLLSAVLWTSLGALPRKAWPLRGAPFEPKDLATATLVVVRVVDEGQHRSGVDLAFSCAKATGEHGLWSQTIALIEVPHLFCIRAPRGGAIVALQEVVQVVDVAKEQLPCIRVVSRIDRLGKVDEHRPVGTEKNVEVGQVAVNDARRQHADHLLNETTVDRFSDGKRVSREAD